MTPTQTTSGNTPSLSTVTMQGVAIENAIVDPTYFFANTRRQRLQIASPVAAFQGLGNTDSVTLKKTGILGAIDVKAVGSVVVTLNSGTCATTAKWPYDLPKLFRLSANGQSNIVNASGAKLKARHLMTTPGLTDRGVVEGVGGASPGTQVNQSTLALASESWGLGKSVTAVPAGTYNFDLTWRLPIAWDLIKLLGAVYLQTSSTSIDLNIDWSPTSDLFVLTGGATAVVSCAFTVEGITFTIPPGPGNQGIVIPDLSVFHTITQSNITGLGQTTNEQVIPGQGVGKTLMRLIGQWWDLAAGSPGAPLVLNESNFGNIGWEYGGNVKPEIYTDGMAVRRANEEVYGVDIGGAGLFALDFANYWGFRDSVDEGDASQLTLVIQVLNAVTNPRLELVREEIVGGAS